MLTLSGSVGVWKSLCTIGKVCPMYGGTDKYHVVLVPKYRKKIIYGNLKPQVGPILRRLCQQRVATLLEGHAMPDHIHLCLSISPKFSIAHTIEYLKGKSAVLIYRQILQERRVTGLSFWSIGYCVSTVGLYEETIRKYIRDQDILESGQGDLDLK